MSQDWAKCVICSSVKPRDQLVAPPLPFRASWESCDHQAVDVCCPDHRILLFDGARVLGPGEARGAAGFLSGGMPD